MNHLLSESPIDRLKRSRANQEQIEQTVLEYEKTIHTLESNLSSTRTLLAHTQTNLLEKETKCTRTDTINRQLHSRVQKLMDRESNNKTYLRDLEARLDGQISGKEKSGAIIIEVQKEIARVRESEANAEDYISTLEERLAEADQDMETMQREIERLEHVVERQRSLGKLDSLLHGLDHTPRGDVPFDTSRSSHSIVKSTCNDGRADNETSLAGLEEAEQTALPEASDDDLLESSNEGDDASSWIKDSDLKTLVRATTGPKAVGRPNPAQPKIVAEHFEKITSELFTLRLEHENTMNQFQLLSAKYEEALQTLARGHEAEDGNRDSVNSGLVLAEVAPRPVSPLEEVQSIDSEADIPLPSSRSLSSEFSLADGNSSVDGADTAQSSRDVLTGDLPSPDVEKLRRMLAEHEHGMSLVTQQYAQLQAEHQQTLETVDTLKAEMQKTKVVCPPSPGQLSPVIRRATSQNLILTDRANRSLASLRTLCSEEFEAKSSKMEMAEVHLNAASHELQSRLERIQSLETEMRNLRKEMDAKMAIISGLTRERNSLKGSSPVDLSMVSQIRDQLIQNENEIRTLHENHASREEELLAEIQALRGSNANRTENTKAIIDSEQANEVHSLENDPSKQRMQNQAAVASLESSHRRSIALPDESQMPGPSADVATIEQDGDGQDTKERPSAAGNKKIERGKHEHVTGSLTREIEAYKASIACLEQEKDSMRLSIAQHQRENDEKDQQLASQREQLADLGKQATEQQVSSLHENHNHKVKHTQAGKLAGLDGQAHERGAQTKSSQRDVQSLVDGAGSILGHDTSADMRHSRMRDLVREKIYATELHKKLTQANAELQNQLESSRDNRAEPESPNLRISDYQVRLRSLAEENANHEEMLREKEEMIKKQEVMIESIDLEKKNSARIIEELELQIETSFDHHHNRLSVVQQQGNQALIEAQARIVTLEKELETLRGTDNTSRTNTMKSGQGTQAPHADHQNRDSSMSSNLRKSASVASLPSPPPAIPLPPLPALATLPPTATVNGLSNSNTSASPPSSRHASKELRPVSNHQTQLMEDQEARIRTTEKHLNAEKQLTATLEEALVDLETQSNKLRGEMDGWKKKAWSAEEELQSLRRDKKHARESIQAVEMERDKRREAEAARAQLEERMNQLSRKKKKNALNCF